MRWEEKEWYYDSRPIMEPLDLCSPAVRDTLTMGNPHEMPQDPVSSRNNETIMTAVKEAVPSGHGSSARTSLPQDVYRHATS